jgi:hypothetical protein
MGEAENTYQAFFFIGVSNDFQYQVIMKGLSTLYTDNADIP